MHAIATLEGLSVPILDVVRTQILTQITSAATAGQITTTQAQTLKTGLDTVITAIRADRPIPTSVPSLISNAFPAADQTYLRTEDAIDPRALAAHLPHHMAVLMTCSTADIQVLCREVRQTYTAAQHADHHTRLVTLTGIDHPLKVDNSHTSTYYDADLAFSPQLDAALHAWTHTTARH